MSAGPQRFTQVEAARALRAAHKSGVPNPRVEIEPKTGKITIAFGEPQTAASQPTANEWDMALAK
jgi:hypothetical protein